MAERKTCEVVVHQAGGGNVHCLVDKDSWDYPPPGVRGCFVWYTSDGYAFFQPTTHSSPEEGSGVWMVWDYGEPSIPFATELEALRYALQEHKKVSFVKWGESP